MSHSDLSNLIIYLKHVHLILYKQVGCPSYILLNMYVIGAIVILRLGARHGIMYINILLQIAEDFNSLSKDTKPVQ